MALMIHAFCGYPDYRGAGSKYDSDDFDAQKFTKAARGEDFGGYGYINNTKGDRTKFTSSNTLLVTDIFAEWATRVLRSQELGAAALVPIPASSQTDFSGLSASARLAEAIERKNRSYELTPILAWNKPSNSRELRQGPQGKMRPVSYGGLLANLKCAQEKISETIVLVDDIVATGKHMRACATFLRSLGAKCDLGLCVGKVIRKRPSNLYSIEAWDLDSGDA